MIADKVRTATAAERELLQQLQAQHENTKRLLAQINSRIDGTGRSAERPTAEVHGGARQGS